MKRIKNKKIITILSIIFIISLIFIAGTSQATQLYSRANLVKAPNIGNTIYMTQTRKGPIQLFKEEDHVYCIQHRANSTAGMYKVIAHADISGKTATIYTKSGTSKPIESKDNVILAYICGEENYPKGYGGVRMRAIHEYLVRPWYKDVGFPGGIPKEWNDAGFSLNNHPSVKAAAESLIKNAKNYAKNTNSIKPVINEKQSSKEMNSISTTTAGPFKIKYQGVIESVTVSDNSGKTIASNKISFSTDVEGKNKVDATKLKPNEKYYVHNTSNKTLGKVSIKLKASETLTAKLWFLQREDGAASQRFLTVDTNKTTSAAKTHVITIKPAVGNLTISKTDKDTGEKLAVGFKVQTSSGKWVSGTSGSYTYNNEYNKAQTYTTTNGTVTLKDLKFDTYKVYEVRAANGYKLEDQEGYDLTNKWVYFGEATINEKTKEITKTISNIHKISIKGYVWIDKKSNKDDTYNSLYDESNNEQRVAGVKVRLINKNTKKPVMIGNSDYVTTNANGEYLFNKILTTGQLKDHYVEFNYNGVKVVNGETTEDISKYIPVAFNSANINEIKANGSRAMMDSVPEKDVDLSGIATTYKGTDKESTYGLGYNGNLYKKLLEGTTLNNINLGIKKIPDAEYKITEDLVDVKIVMKGYTYTYTYGGTGNSSRIAAPTVNWQEKGKISGYTANIYPSDISYDVKNSTEELKLYVRYRIDIENQTDYGYGDSESRWKETYVEKALHISNLTDTFDTKRYELHDSNWTAKDGTATINGAYLNDIKENGIKAKDTATKYIEFSVKHDAIVDILNHPYGIIEEYPTKAVATGYHKYLRKDYSWQNNISKDQTHITPNKIKDADAPYLIFKLGEERVLSGKVFEDKVITTDGQKLGNGEYDDKENVVKDVKVELLDVKDGITDITQLPVSNLYGTEGNETRTAISKTAEVYTDENGNYTLNGIVPGKYYLRFTYGDGTQKIYDTSKKEIATLTAKDYKSTIVTNNVAKQALKGGTDEVWYKKLNSTNSSVAIDNLSTRVAVNKGTSTNVMAGTAKLSITIENTETNMANIEITENGEQAKFASNKFNGLNLGIIEQPKQDINLEKVITNIRIKNGQVNLLLSGNPEKDALQGVIDQDFVDNGGSTKLRAEINEQLISGANLELTYEIRINNISDVNYYNNEYYYYGEADTNKEVTLNIEEVLDYLDEKLEYNQKDSDSSITVLTEVIKPQDLANRKVFKLGENGILYTEKNKARQTDKLKTSNTISLVAGRDLSINDQNNTDNAESKIEEGVVIENDSLEFINDVKITKLGNGKDNRDHTDGNTEIEKIKPFETIPTARATTVITPPTGENRQEIIIYTIAGIIALAILSAGIVIIKKIVKK